MQVILDVVHGPRKGTSFAVEGHDTFIVGRSTSVHCPMPEDSALSRDHFLIELSPPRCELRDLGSTNGTFVNDQRVDRVRLRSGDRIAAGQSVFTVRIEGSTEAESSGARTTIVVGPGRSATRCAGCGVMAPPGAESLAEGEPWLCDLCRGEAAATPHPIPNYTVVRELGRGAMGVVYQARHIPTGRLVALKLIIPETAATRTAIDRFLREMSVVSQLKHPNIVEWLEQGMTRGQLWFTMEYVEGTNLEAVADSARGTYPIRQACRMASQVLKGLAHAHAHGFVHRDIKPENILIGQSDRGAIAKISDFGLAKSFRGLGLSGLTFSGEMRGTVPFMPPEQILDFKAVLPSADLYSTAATLYYLISGQFLYDQDADGSGDLIRTLLEESPVPIRRRRPEVPPALGAVLEKGLARDPAERFPTADALRQALRPFC